MLIGLSESAEAYEARGYTPDRLLATQHRFSARFGMPYSFELKPRMSATARACRAIVAARELDPPLGEAALRALQLMHFTTAGLLDDDEDLRGALAPVPGLDADAVVGRIDDPEVVAAYEADRARARSAEGSPTHAQDRFSTSDGPVRYTAPSVIFEHADGGRLEVGGFQPFEAYDTALANLDVTLKRRRAPASALEALYAVPGGTDHGRAGKRDAPERPRGRRLRSHQGRARRAGGSRRRGARAGRRGCGVAGQRSGPGRR